MSDIEIDVPEPSPEHQVRQALAEIQPWLLERNTEALTAARTALLTIENSPRRLGKRARRKEVNRLAGERYVIRRMAAPEQDPFGALDVLYGLSLQYDDEAGYQSSWHSTWACHVWTQHQGVLIDDGREGS